MYSKTKKGRLDWSDLTWEQGYSRKGRREWKTRKKSLAATGWPQNRRIFWKLKEEAQDLNLWRNRFSRFCGLAVRQTIDYHYHLLLLLHIIKVCAATILNVTLTTSEI